MGAEEFHAAALSLPAAPFDVKWGNRNYCVGSKIFAGAGAWGCQFPAFTFKTSDVAFDALISQGLARPAPDLGRFKWLEVRNTALLDDVLLSDVAQSHALVASKLTQAIRRHLGLRH